MLHELVHRHPFGILVSGADGTLTATHVPFLVDADDTGGAAFGTLVTHVARANPQWRSLGPDHEVMVIFRGPHAYVSPGWYQDQTTVPTWNYAAVHCYGRPALVHDLGELRSMTTRLTHVFEPPSGGDWDLAQAEPVMHAELRAIVGIRIPVSRAIGKLKLNQNRSRADQQGVIRALESSRSPDDRALGRLMRERWEAHE